MKKYTCPVCGWPDLVEIPWTEKLGGSYEICSSCGFEFGVSDDDLGFTYVQWRQDWINQGMPWSGSDAAPPVGWNPREQLTSVCKAE